LLQQDKFAEAVIYFEKALTLCNDPVQQVALLSDAGSAYSFKARYAPGLAESEKTSVFAKANECFAKCTDRNPHYGNGWMRWAMSLHREGNFPKS
jgi:tetratricopeptide (TPR) repeat protein